MKVILNHDVQNLGEEGDVRDVARGYARNFLFRKDLAVPYTKQNVAVFEHKKKAIEKRKEEKRTAAAGLKDRIEALKLELVMPAGDTGKLFGSVTTAMLAEEMEKKGISVERKKIDLPGSIIKMTGEHSFSIRLYENESAKCSITILSEKKVKEASSKDKAVEKEAEKKPAAEEAEEAPDEENAEAEDAAASEESFESDDEFMEEEFDEDDEDEEAEESDE